MVNYLILIFFTIFVLHIETTFDHTASKRGPITETL